MTKYTFHLVKNYKQPIVVFAGLVSVSLFFVLIHFSKKTSPPSTLPFQISDTIPSGFVMVPIELENHSAVNDLIPSFGVVDLYRLGKNKPHKLARAVRIVRLETGRFSVLIPEHDVAVFVQHQFKLYAVVQNSEKKGSQIIPPHLKRKRAIIIEEHDEKKEEWNESI